MASGRPREFETDQALDRAMELFWRKGYEGTSLSDLTSALGVTRSSLYAAFGNKQALFLAVLDRYEGKAGRYRVRAVKAPTAREVARELLEGAARLHGDARNPLGCLGIQSALACGEEAHPIRQELTARRLAGERAIRHRLKRALKEGDLPKGSDPSGLTHYLSAVIYGMSVLAYSGASLKDLLQVAEVAMTQWPVAEFRRGDQPPI